MSSLPGFIRNDEPRPVDVYSPPAVVEACREAMGGIDLDPASCAEANRVVRADRYYTAADDGLAQPWSGRVFCNPPFNGGNVRRFALRMLADYHAGSVSRGCLFAPMVGAKWVDELTAHADALMVMRFKLPWWGPAAKSTGAYVMGVWMLDPLRLPDCELSVGCYRNQRVADPPLTLAVTR